MNRIIQLLRRAWCARSYNVRFAGMSHTRLPEQLRFAGRLRTFRMPPEPLIVADFVNVVLDDDYGLRTVTPPPAIVVDIGGNIGLFAAFAREQFPAATIHVYEPSPATAEYARFNAADPATTIFVEGVSEHAGRAAMVELGSTNLARTELAADGEIVLTPFATVVERIGGAIDLLKIDCEGAEWDFMKGADVFARVAAIRMEYHLVDGRTLDDLEQLAADIGFRIARLVPNQGFGIAWLERT